MTMIADCKGSQAQHVSRGLWRFGWGISLVTHLGLLCFYYLPRPKRLMGDEGYYFNLARQIAENQVANHHPFWPPLYGETIGWFFSAFGQHIWLIQAIQIFLLFATAWLFRDVIGRLSGQMMLANVVGLLFLVWPELVAFSHYLWPETLHLFFMIAALWLWIRWPDAPWSAPLAGFGLGLALLTKLLLLPFLPLALISLVWLAKEARIATGKRVLLAGIAVLVVLAPTLWTNKQLYDQFMIGDSSLFNIWVGLNDSQSADYRGDISGASFLEWEASADSWQEKKRIYREKIKTMAAEQGWWSLLLDQFPRQYRRLLDPHSFMVTQLPGGPRQTYAGQPNWAGWLLKGWAFLCHGVILSLASFGVWLVGWRRPSFWWLLAGFLLFNLALFWLVHIKTRFLIQMMPALLPFAALTIQAVFCRWRPALWQQNPALQVSKRRLISGAILAVIVLAISFWPR